jgi:hypothetical protein
MKPECQLIGENGNVKMKFGIVSIIISAILFFSMSVQGEMVQRSDGTWVQAPATPPPVKRAPVYNGIGNAIGTYVSSHRSMYSCQKELDRAFRIQRRTSYILYCIPPFDETSFRCRTKAGKNIKWSCTSDGDLYCNMSY